MTFSGDFDPQEVIIFVRNRLRHMGFLLNEQKTKIRKAGTRQTVTGLVVNETCSIPAEYRRRLRQELYYCKKYGPDSHLAHTGSDESTARMLQRLLGSVSHCLQAAPCDPELLADKAWILHAIRHQNSSP